MLVKKMLRDMREHKMQFIAIFLMSFLTLMIYAGVGAEYTGIQQTVDAFYEDTNMADIWVYSNNINNDTFDKIKSMDSTLDAERQLVMDTTANLESDPSVKLHFIESNRIAKYYPVDANDIDLSDKEGIWVDKKFADAHKLKVGDNITLKYNGITIEKTIRGLGYSPEYVYQQADESIVPDSKLQGFAYVSYKAFPGENVPYSTVLVKTDDTADVYQQKFDDRVNLSNYTVLPFKDHSSVIQFQSEIDQHKMLGSMFPVIFVVVAILTLITTMTRIVSHQRTQIGTLKALGFTDKSLILHYISYGFYLTVIGSILGLIIGVNSLPYLFFPSMSSFYTLPVWKSGFDLSFAYVAILLIMVAVAFTYLSTKNIVRETPAQALEPKAPKVSGNSILERTRVWSKLGFNARWNIRDIKRNKIRSLVTIVSVMGCTILLISAFGMSDGMSDLKTWQYGTINHYDNQLIIDDNATIAQIDDVAAKVNGTKVMTKPIEVKVNDIKKTVNVNVYNESELITPTDENMHQIKLPSDGVTLTRKTAELLGVDEGDSIQWHLYGEDKWINSTIDEINADPSNQGITLSQDKLEEFGYNFTPSMIVTNNEVNDSYDGISSIFTIGQLQNSWDDMMESGNLLIAVLLVFALLLSLVMLYSLGVLSFTEVEIDLATLKVIGFKSNVIRRLFLTQQVTLAIVGFIIGVPLGYGVLRVMMDSSGDTFYYPVHYKPLTIIISFVCVIALTVIVNLLLSRKIKQIDMVESLKKTRE
ncbi:MAG: cell division protein FtsX [Methanosphaera sp. rholeuAM130]|nr:MAG: cell division protein FtsX [Methanosphaera sp. rholeuAM130]